MNEPRFDDCLEEVRKWVASRKDIETAIVYGSAARGTARAESDLDMFLVVRGDCQDVVANALYSIGNRFDVTISPYFVEHGDIAKLDRQFVESVTRDQMALKGRPLNPTLEELDLKPHFLVTLYLDHISQKRKMKLSRELYGYRSVRKYKRRKYASEAKGFLDRVGGRKLGRGTILVPADAWPGLDSLVRKYNGKRWAFTVWIQNP